MAPYILGNHVHVVSPQEKIDQKGNVTANYMDKEGEPTENLGEAKVFDVRGDAERFAIKHDVEASVIIVTEKK